MSARPLAERARARFAGLQDEICRELEALEPEARFREDRWTHDREGGSGGGRSRVLENGALFEKGGVNLADVRGLLSERIAERLQVAPQPFLATGISLVLHPVSPRVPTVHMNMRYLELPEHDGPRAAWFGGGADLTPYYLEPDDVRGFHRTWREVCERHEVADHARFKRWCDEYFHNAHRGEARGVGGIFFDYLHERLEAVFGFVDDAGSAFLDAYLPIVRRRRGEPYGERERDWQLVRRGRYVEFNLVHDRGTLFGLETGGRTESILMSLPPLVRWRYDHHPEPGSPEAELLAVLRRPRDW